jgi:hypothetical protein
VKEHSVLNPRNERSELSGEAGHRQAVVALPVEGVLNPNNCVEEDMR